MKAHRVARSAAGADDLDIDPVGALVSLVIRDKHADSRGCDPQVVGVSDRPV